MRTLVAVIVFSAQLMLTAVTVAAQSAAASNSQAQDRAPLTDLAIEDLVRVKVYAASKLVQDVARAPASVSIITSSEIRNHGYRTLADILRSVRGFYVSYDRNYSYVGIRGFSRPGDYNDRVLLLVNGHRLNDIVFEQALVGTESPIDVALIDRVEVIRGPSSSLYGTSAFFGVINIITRTGRSLSGVELEGQTGSQMLRAGRFTAGGRSDRGLEGLFSVSGYGSEGNRALYFPEFDTSGEGHGVARDADGDQSISTFGTIAWKGMQLQAGLGSRQKSIPTGAFDTVFGDPRTQTIDARGFVDVEYTRQTSARSTIQARTAYDHYDYSGRFPYESGLFEDAAHGAWSTTEVAWIRQFDRHGLTAGAEYQHNFRQDQSAVNETGTLLDDRRGSKAGALYVEDEVRVTSRVLINAGLRWDHYFDAFGGTVNPRVGLIVMPVDGGALKVLYGQAFRAPNPFELYYDQNALSATLQPERIATSEIVWEQRVASQLRVTASAFHNHASDLIVQREGSDTLDGLYFQNGDSVKATGAELEVQASLPQHLQGRLAHAFQSANDSMGQGISNSPRHVTSLVLDRPIGRSGWLAGFNAYRVGARRGVSGDLVRAALVADLTVSRQQPARGVGVAVSIHNVLNAHYSDPGSVEHRQHAIPQDGPTLGVRASWRF